MARARAVAENHMVGCERDGSSWREETISELLWQAARPYVMYADFTRHQEKEVGADWLWWVDNSGECFGMLVQAKRLHRRGTCWELDFRASNGEQMARVFRTADLFQVPATYALYLGSMDYRVGLTCGSRHTSGCLRCGRASVSVLPGLLAELAAEQPHHAAEAALRGSVPLEDLADPTADPGPIIYLGLDSIDPAFRSFLRRRQQGARHVAKMIVERVRMKRLGQFEPAVADHVDTDTAAVFPELPGDRGHFNVPYFPHLLRGLRTDVPAYVLDVLAG